MREETDDGHDPFDRLLDPGFLAGAAHREPSADDRRRAAERAARQQDLQRRLAADEAQRVRESRVQGRSARRGRLRERSKRFAAFALLAAVVGAAAWYQSRGGPGSESVTGPHRPADFPPVDKSASKTPLAEPPPLPPSPGAYEFLMTQKTGVGPVAWDPCRPIRYVINPAGAPPGADGVLREAVLRTAVPTGLEFIDEGTTTETWSKDREPYQPDRYGKKWAPVLIAWSTEAQSPQVAGYIAGRGGPLIKQTPDGRLASVSGSVILDAEDIGRVLMYPRGQAKARAIIQHELGHLVGLDHTSDKAQLMYSEHTDEQRGDWGTGDLAGLHQLGKGDCFPDL